MTDRELGDVPLINAYPLFQRLVLAQLGKLHFKYTKTQFTIFSVLSNHDALTMGQIAQFISSSNEQATRAVAPLADDGYVERFTEPENRTRVYVRLTAAGREYITAFREELIGNLDKSLRESLSGQERQELHEALVTVVRLMSKIKE